MKTLIIAKPSLLNSERLWEIIKKAEEKKLRIMGIKMMLLDIHKIEIRAKEKEQSSLNARINKRGQEEEKNNSAALKVPCILVALEGDACEEVAKEIKERFGRNVHTSLNSEIANYEIQRFFLEKEIFEYDKVGQEVFFGKESPEWKKYSKMGVLEIEKERAGQVKANLEKGKEKVFGKKGRKN